MIEAVAYGWKVRRIMKLAEIKSRASLVTDHDSNDLTGIDKSKIRESRKNATVRYINLFNQFAENGSWVMIVRQNEFKSGNAKMRGRRQQKQSNLS